MKKLLFLASVLFLTTVSGQKSKDKTAIETVLNDWHKAAADGKFEAYFGAMTRDAIFIGTDPAENWSMDAFKAFSKPYFDKGKAWDFKPVERNIYFSPNGEIVWFDELLDTWMKLCRGSGVMVKENGKWKIAHYVLSMTIPNDNTIDVIKVIEKNEDAYLEKLKKK